MAKNDKTYLVALVVMMCNGTPVFKKVNVSGRCANLSLLESIKSHTNKEYGSECVVDVVVLKTEKQADAYMVKYMKEWEEI